MLKAAMSSVITFFLLASVLIAAFLRFDQLVRLEYESYRRIWEADGKPHGFFWVPAESRSLGGWRVKASSGLASKRCALVWLFSTPEWIQRDDRAGHLLLWLRILVLVWNAGIISIAAATLM